MTDDARRLLAGYATNTLSQAERKTLFEAALEDPELFAELANEEPLRELLAQPDARGELLKRIEPAKAPFRERFAAWLRRPGPLAGLATAATVIAILAIVPLLMMHPEKQSMETATIAERPVAPATVPPAPVEQQAAEPPEAKPARSKRKSTSTVVVPQPKGEAAAPPPEVAQQPAAPIEYALLRRDSEGNFVEVDKRAPLEAGAVVKLRFHANASGRLSVRDAERSLYFGQVPATTPVEVGPIDMDRDYKLEVAFHAGVTPAARMMAFQPDAERRKAAVADVVQHEKAENKLAAEKSEGVVQFEIVLRRK